MAGLEAEVVEAVSSQCLCVGAMIHSTASNVTPMWPRTLTGQDTQNLANHSACLSTSLFSASIRILPNFMGFFVIHCFVIFFDSIRSLPKF